MVGAGPRRHCHRLMFDGVTCLGITKAREGMGGCELGRGRNSAGNLATWSVGSLCVVGQIQGQDVPMLVGGRREWV